MPGPPHLYPNAREALLHHLRSAAPEEGCGVLLGRRTTPPEIVESFPARNVAAGDRTLQYTLAPEDLIAALARARAVSLEILGFYHSHPDRSPHFSSADQAAAWPRMLYLVVSLHSRRAPEFSWYGIAP